MNLHHRLTQWSRSARIAKAPAGHGKGLAEAVQQDRALTHAGKLHDALVLTAIVQQLAVDLVGEDQQIMLHRQRGDLRQLLMRHDAARRIRGKVQRDDLRLRRDRLLHILGHQRKFILFTGLHHDWNAISHLDAR